MESVIAYLVAAMMSWVPLAAQSRFESPQQARARYESIARDAVAVAFDPDEASLFGGPEGRLDTAMLMLSIASFESAYRKDVDEGDGRGDHGGSYCLMQIYIGTSRTQDGWDGADILRDRRLCFRAALHAIRGSFGVCRKLPAADRLSAYATGRCMRDLETSRVRMGRARHWTSTHWPHPKEG